MNAFTQLQKVNFAGFAEAKHSAFANHRKLTAEAARQESGGGVEEAKDGHGDDSALIARIGNLKVALLARYEESKQSHQPLTEDDLRRTAIVLFEDMLKEGKANQDDDKEEDIFLEVAKQLMARNTSTHIYLFLILTFLVLVSTSNTLFQLLKCRHFEVPGEDHQSYLYIDYSVDCLSPRYSTARTFAIVNIVICELGLCAYYSHLFIVYQFSSSLSLLYFILSPFSIIKTPSGFRSSTRSCSTVNAIRCQTQLRWRKKKQPASQKSDTSSS